MKLENQVISLDLAKRLKELGVKQQNALFFYAHQGLLRYRDSLLENWDQGSWVDWLKEVNGGDVYAAFTVAELGEMLPPITKSGKTLAFNDPAKKWNCDTFYMDVLKMAKPLKHNEFGATEAEARGLMLAYLIENNLLKP